MGSNLMWNVAKSLFRGVFLEKSWNQYIWVPPPWKGSYLTAAVLQIQKYVSYLLLFPLFYNP